VKLCRRSIHHPIGGGIVSNVAIAVAIIFLIAVVAVLVNTACEWITTWLSARAGQKQKHQPSYLRPWWNRKKIGD